jgi:hypothetical protein
MNPRVKKVTPASDYKLHIEFTNGEQGIYDCSPLLEFGVFKELQDRNYFMQAKAWDGTVVWPHEQDICPDTLYLDSVKNAEQGAQHGRS